MSQPPTVLFAGGGSGGHIFPNLAIIERLAEMGAEVQSHLLLSDRELDHQIARDARQPFTKLPAQPLHKSPGGMVRFMMGYQRSVKLVRDMIAERQVAALVATGGFVGGPALAAAARAGIPATLVNLDAVPGRANQVMAKRASRVFSAYPEVALPEAEWIGMPLRPSVVREEAAGPARQRFELEPERPTLLITAGSQGARTVNQAMIALCERPAARQALSEWQVLHLSGTQLFDEVEQAYAQAGVRARVLRFSREMGAAWSAATLAISRAGAGGVAEAWANHVPTLFMPYPYHSDQHQRHNAQPMVDTGGALLLDDHIEPQPNADQLERELLPLLGDAARLREMRTLLSEKAPPDGAGTVAQWVRQCLGR